MGSSIQKKGKQKKQDKGWNTSKSHWNVLQQQGAAAELSSGLFDDRVQQVSVTGIKNLFQTKIFKQEYE